VPNKTLWIYRHVFAWSKEIGKNEDLNTFLREKLEGELKNSKRNQWRVLE
jgi:hypothetical protein